MLKDYRFELLRHLYKKGTVVNIRATLNGYLGEHIRDKAFFESMLYSLRENGLVWINDGQALSLEEDPAYEMAHPIMAKLEQEGIYEYYRLKQIARRKSSLDIVAVVIGITASAFIIWDIILKRIFHVP